MTRGFGTEFERLRARQAGVLTLASAVGCAGRPAVRSRLASGRWRLVAVRVLVTQSGPLTDQQQLWVAVLAAEEAIGRTGEGGGPTSAPAAFYERVAS
jgi:hypothetical protein